MTTTTQQIAELSVEDWAALTRRAAVEAVEAAQRRGKTPPAELVAVAALTERQLIERRARNGSAPQRLSPFQRLVEADHARRVAEARARDAHQAKLDAEAAAAAARAEAEESARTAAAARAQARAAQQQAAQRDTERTAERAATAAAHEGGLQELREELARVRADAEAEIATALERANAAETRAQQRAAERKTAAEGAEQAMQKWRAELEKLRADTDAEVATARERAAAAEARADQRTAERTAASEAAEKSAQELRGDLERVRADAEAEVAAARGWAAGEAQAARDAADAEIARAYAAADEVVRQAQAKAARTLSMPVPPFEFRSETAFIENALNALHQIDYMLEVGMASDDPDVPLDIDLMQTLVRVVEEHARYLTDESRGATSSLMPAGAAADYAEAAEDAFRGLLQRIESVVTPLEGRYRSPDAEIVNLVTSMLADPWVQRARRSDPQRA
ncbi:hypothetical protein [Mycobacterium sp. 1274761.0]|uniref:hypothetical protein n=1 Tax=Mycobacterium sp. 1274761.0 TaxID=1834077 RepID=UPI000800A9DE|nr:hypothetical protein [Mycobacterium sp. 1274761.0]OBK76012.1 hypothetical protein A5651_06920 [Mycobacterium sp. 1274761.0]